MNPAGICDPNCDSSDESDIAAESDLNCHQECYPERLQDGNALLCKTRALDSILRIKSLGIELC
jgi:hypothetical protein